MIIYVRACIGAGDDDGTIRSALIIGLFQRLYQLRTRQVHDVREAGQAQLREGIEIIVRQHTPQPRGIPEDARALQLAHHLRQRHLMHLQPVALQHLRGECGTLLLPHRRQLCRVAHEHQAAALARIDKMHKVVQQTARTEGRAAGTGVGNHRGLVHDEQRVAKQVHALQEVGHLPREGLLAIDSAMDGEGRMTGVQGKDLGGTTRGSHEHHLLLQLHQRTHQSPHERRLSGARIPPQNENAVSISLKKEIRHHFCRNFLLFGGPKPEILED